MFDDGEELAGPVVKWMSDVGRKAGGQATPLNILVRSTVPYLRLPLSLHV